MAELRGILSKLSGSAGQFTFQALKRPHHHEREGVDHHRETQLLNTSEVEVQAKALAKHLSCITASIIE